MILAELSQALRALRRHFSLSVAVLLTLGFGIGVNAAAFAFADAMLLRPRPGVWSPDRLVWITTIDDAGHYNLVSYLDYLDYRSQTHSVSSLAAYAWERLFLGRGGGAVVPSNLVSSNYFATLGIRLSLGRQFLPSEEVGQESPFVAIISDRFWRRQFRASAQVLGTVVTLNGKDFTIVGVAPSRFTGMEVTNPADVWVPLSAYSELKPEGRGLLRRRGEWRFLVLGRLAPARSAREANAEIQTIGARIQQQYPTTHRGMRRAGTLPVRGGVYPFHYFWVIPLLATILLVTGAIVVLTCLSISSLFAVRAIARRSELAVRFACGATRLRLALHLLPEVALLFLLGGAVSVAVYPLTQRILLAAISLPFPVELNASLSHVVLVALALAMFSGLAAGLLPAVGVTEQALRSVLTDAGSGSGAGRGNVRLRSILIGVQVAGSFVLLVVAGSLAWTGRHIRERLSRTTISGDIIAAQIDLRAEGLPTSQRELLLQRIVDAAAIVPNVRGVTLAGTVPVAGHPWRGPVRFMPGRSEVERNAPLISYDLVSPGFFKALGVHIRIGREFTPDDQPSTPRAAIVNEAFCRRFWPTANPLGKRVFFSDSAGSVEVVGVVDDIPYAMDIESSSPMVYLPRSQYPDDLESPVVVVRVGRVSREVKTALYERLKALDPSLSAADIASAEELFDASLVSVRTLGLLLLFGATVALIITGVALYGLISYAVARRAHDLGVRMALGAPTWRLLLEVVRESVGAVVGGLAVGAVLSPIVMNAVTRSVGSTSKLEASAAAVALAAVAVTAVAGTFIPAKRVLMGRPMDALRAP